jgi:uncharacterized protein YndB with AHSA1/START domain
VVEVSMTVQATREQVFAVLADGWSFASWVVGASHIRAVDVGWPKVGSRIHHSVGPWPIQVHDITSVRAVEEPRLLELDARLWPFGAARVRLELDSVDNGATRVRMYEQVVRGPGRVLPNAAQAVVLIPRNRESLRRLADIAMGRERPTAQIEQAENRPTTLQDEAAHQDDLQAERQGLH